MATFVPEKAFQFYENRQELCINLACFAGNLMGGLGIVDLVIAGDLYNKNQSLDIESGFLALGGAGLIGISFLAKKYVYPKCLNNLGL